MPMTAGMNLTATAMNNHGQVLALETGGCISVENPRQSRSISTIRS